MYLIFQRKESCSKTLNIILLKPLVFINKGSFINKLLAAAHLPRAAALGRALG